MRKRANKKLKKKRDIFLKIRVSEEELEAFKRKFNNSGMKTFSGFLRAMIFDGHITQGHNHLQRKKRGMGQS